MNCQNYKILIQTYLEGDLSNADFCQLRAHIEKCPACRAEFQQYAALEKIIRSSLAPTTSAQKSADAILTNLAPIPRSQPGLLSIKWISAAAGLLLAAGFTLGLAVSKTTATRPFAAVAQPKVPIKVAALDGVVLVKHRDSDFWQQLRADSDIYLGDTFHSTAKSAFVLCFADESTIELSQNSTLELKLFNGGTEFFLEHGVAAAALNTPHPPFVISTPQGQVTALGTQFKVFVE